jgi:ketosteroid isomerase-like protein
MPSAREVWERAHERVREYDLEGFAEMFAADGVMEMPFAPEGISRRLVGREEIRRVLAPAARASREAGRRILGYSSVVVHQTTDPEVIVVEFDLDGEVTATGERYRYSYVQVVRVRGGEIVLLRDYIDPRVFARG